jgi:hypothetical protein
MGLSREHPTPEDHVFAYLAARRSWEQDAQRRFREAVAAGKLASGLDVIQHDYKALLATYCGPAILNDDPRASFGDPPEENPETTRIAGIRGIKGGAVIVTTVEEEFSPLGHREFEYELEPTDGGWAIQDRRTRDDRGRWIRKII